MKCYFSNSNINAGSPNDNVSHSHSPINSPLRDNNNNNNNNSNNSILMKYLRSSLSPSDQFSLPNSNRPILSYHYHKNTSTTSGSNSSGSMRSPLSAMENLERSPAVVNVDDDVIVMDGILFDSTSSEKRKGGGKFRSPVSVVHDSGGHSSSSSVNSGSGGGGGGYKRELCLAWEDTGACCYGHKCQFAHGQEELRPAQTRSQNRNRLELVMGEPYFSPRSSKQHSPSSLLTPETMKSAVTARPAAASKLNKASPSSVQLNKASPSPSPSPVQLKTIRPIVSKTTSTDWSPLDDGIAVTLPSSTGAPPSREAVDAQIHNVLYGPSQKQRLPVFIDICPE